MSPTKNSEVTKEISSSHKMSSLSAKELKEIIDEVINENVNVSVDKKHSSTKKVMDRVEQYISNYLSLVNSKDRYLELLEAFVEHLSDNAKVKDSDIKWAINRFWVKWRRK